jgi:hypothetical protein
MAINAYLGAQFLSDMVCKTYAMPKGWYFGEEEIEEIRRIIIGSFANIPDKVIAKHYWALVTARFFCNHALNPRPNGEPFLP